MIETISIFITNHISIISMYVVLHLWFKNRATKKKYRKLIQEIHEHYRNQ